MIQELMVGLNGDNRNMSTIMNSPIPSKNGGTTNTTTTATTTTPNNNNNNSELNSSRNHLRCPRCDSTNTKFCYYNNYNLTQPRHFCKACRRYWTKGGTLRNVPIGGGCRKNKTTLHNNSSYLSSNSNAMAKPKAYLSTDMFVNNENSLFLGNGLLDHPFQSPGPNPLVWASLPPQAQNSHIMSLLRSSNSYSNPNLNPSPTSNVFTSLGLDSYGNGNGNGNEALSQLEMFTANYHRQLNGFTPESVNNMGSISNTSGMDLYQRLKTASNNGYYSVNENMKPEPSEGGDHYGLMNTSHEISDWSDSSALPINGASYP